MKRVIIDTDPGDDDAAAILWCLSSDAIQVEALTVTHGNVELEKCVRNALKILEVAERQDIPVHAGATKPLLRPPRHAKWIHGEDGLGDTNLPPPKGKPASGHAVKEIIQRVMESPGEITLLALGPLTNIALAISIEPRLAEAVKEVVLMGGAVRTAGNATAAATFNLVVDPEAAYIVYRSGAPVVQVGLDVCDQVVEMDEHLATLERADTPVTDFLIKILDFRRTKAVREMMRPGGEVLRVPATVDVPGQGKGIRLNDVPTAAYVIAPDLFQGERLYVEIETRGEVTAGATIADLRGPLGQEVSPNATVLLDVEGKQLVERWVQDLVRYGIE